MSQNTEYIRSACLSAGLQAYERGDYDAAEQHFSENLNDMEEIVHSREVVRADLLHCLANVYREKDLFNQSDELYRSAFELTGKEGAPGKSASLQILRDYTISLIMQGKWQEAFACERDAMAFARAISRIHSFEVHTSLSRLAAIAFTQGDYQCAKRYYLRLLQRREGTSSRNEPLMRPLLADLGLICYRLGDFVEAESYFSRALALSPAEDDEESNSLRNSLGLSMCAQGKQKEAQPICQKSAKLRECRTSGDTTTDTLNDLADSFCEKDRFVQARELCESASRCRERAADDSVVSRLKNYCRAVARINCCEKLDRLEQRIERLSLGS